MSLVCSETTIIILQVFTIAVLGYLVGSIKIKGISLGTAAIFIVGLLFGYLGWELPKILQTLGLLLFITSVGFSAGPGFLQRLKKNGLYYVIVCLTTALTGCLLCIAVIKIFKVETPLAVGLMTGAFTTSPGFAAAKEAVETSEIAVSQVAAGYGMAYPVGLICKVLFIQLVPKILNADMDVERQRISLPNNESIKDKLKNSLVKIDKMGLFSFCVAAIIGLLIGSIQIPLPGGMSFSLGTTGGPLLASLLMGCWGHIGKWDITCCKSVIAPFKEMGLVLFFTGAGIEGGAGIGAIIEEYGFTPMLYVLLIVLVSLMIGFSMAYKVVKLPLLNSLGAMTASMTCTPSLAILTQISETDDVVAAYATTYPVALIMMVLVVQFLVLL